MATRTIAIIPARGGSTRIHNKNLRQVGDKPLVAYSIEQAQESEQINKAVVSTDSERIRDVSREHGGYAPFLRPDDLATDTASITDVITHALEWFENHGETFETACLLQPTSPLRTKADIDGALAQFEQSDAKTLVSVTEYTQPPQFAVYENENGYLSGYANPSPLFDDEYIREQDIKDIQYPNGAIYAADVDVWSEIERFYTDRTIAFEMPPERSLEIDEPWELKFVSAYLERTK